MPTSLALATGQFGLEYGIANWPGKVDIEDVMRIPN